MTMVLATALGISADGSNQLSNMAAALTRAAGRTLYFPKGTYVFDLSSNATLTPLPGTKFVGDAGTVLRFGGAAATRNVFNIINNDVAFENLSIEIDAATTAQGAVIQIFRPGGGARDFRLREVNIDGRIGSNHLVFVISPIGTAGHDFRGIHVEGGYFHHLTRMYLRVLSTDQTATISSMQFRNARFEAFSRDVVALNSPYGETSDVLFEGVSFSGDMDTEILLAIGSARNIRVISCDFSGSAKEAIHIEESLLSAVIAGSTFQLSRADAIAVFITDNNYGSGRYVCPRNIAISSNIIIGPGKANVASRGVLLVNDPTGTRPADGVIGTGNIIEGFGRAISATDATTNSLLVWNILRESGVAIWSVQPLPRSEDNLFVGNDEDIHVQQAA